MNRSALILGCAQTLRFFSQYGTRAILVLYMVDRLGFSDRRAFGVSALFCGLIELGAIFGGILADRMLGLRRAVMLGAPLMALGYLGLMFERGLYIALGLVIVGGTLFWSNVAALFGACYQKEDSCRERGFTLFYMFQNLGALVAILLCGFIAKEWGYRPAFALAALGMVVCSCLLLRLPEEKSRRIQKGYSLIPIGVLLLVGVSVVMVYENIFLPLLPPLAIALFLFFSVKIWRDRELPKEKVRLLFVYLGALILFFAGEDQICSSLMMFTERETERTLFGWTLPSSVIMGINPIVILFLGTVVAKASQKLWRLRLLIPFLLVGVAFGMMALVRLSFPGVLGVVAMISLAELMIGPLVMSFNSEVASEGKAGLIMGLHPIAFSLSFLLGGGFSKMVAAEEAYGAGFGKIALILTAGGLLLTLLMRRLRLGKEELLNS